MVDGDVLQVQQLFKGFKMPLFRVNQHIDAAIIGADPDPAIRTPFHHDYRIGAEGMRIVGVMSQSGEAPGLPIKVVKSPAIGADPDITLFILQKIANNIVGQVMAET